MVIGVPRGHLLLVGLSEGSQDITPNGKHQVIHQHIKVLFSRSHVTLEASNDSTINMELTHLMTIIIKEYISLNKWIITN